MSAIDTIPLRLVTSGAPVDRTSRVSPAIVPESVTLRSGHAADGAAIHALIVEHRQEGHLLPRDLHEITVRADRFIVVTGVDATGASHILGCAELAPLSRTVAEVRSLVVGAEARGLGLGRRIVDEIVLRGSRAGFQTLCAFTHSPAYFVHMGFSIVPHVWLSEKILTDCCACPEFRSCGQYAVIRPLARSRDAGLSAGALHG
jgi:amino-acid N-acetyltransferase